MHVRCSCAFMLILVTQYFGTPRANDVGDTAAFSDADKSGTPEATGASASAEVDSDIARYEDDIFSQSGGVRLRAEELTADGVHLYKQFMTHERQAQRAYIWQRLKLRNINFVHSAGDTSWVTQKRAPTPIMHAMVGSFSSDGALKGSSKAAQNAWRETINDIFPPHLLDRVSVEHVRDIEWNFDHLAVFRDSVRTRPRYNDQPGALRTNLGDDAASIFAYNDPRYRESDAVVNYRVNTRDLVNERLQFLGCRDPSRGGRELRTLDKAVERIAKRRHDSNFQSEVLERSLRRSTAEEDVIDIDVNVETLLARYHTGGDRDAPLFISGAIDAYLEDAYGRNPPPAARKVFDATSALRELAQEETVATKRYATFNDPRAAVVVAPQLELKDSDTVRENIEKVYQRALARRMEFHEMTEPVVVHMNDRSPTFRVHFGDLDRRYVEKETVVLSEKPKAWYRAIWKRLLEPIFKDVVIDELRDTTLRNIVLVHSDDVRQPRVLAAYVTVDGRDIVIHCAIADGNPATMDYVLRHEYEHTVEYSTDSIAVNFFRRAEKMHDAASLTQETIKNIMRDISKKIDAYTNLKIEKATAEVYGRDTTYLRSIISGVEDKIDALEENRDRWKEVLRDVEANRRPFTFNADESHGFVSSYAQTSMEEAVAEQRYAMRNTALRTALLRRLALGRPTAHAARLQKQLYDAARHAIRDVSPRLYAQWGENYDNVEHTQWGLLPAFARAPRENADIMHYQVVALDDTLATKMASENLATYFLQRGYDVALFGQTIRREYNPATQTSKYIPLRVCTLQSNLLDPAPGSPHLTSTLHLVGGSNLKGKDVAKRLYDYFTELTPTGRVNTAKKYNPNFVEVTFVRSPFDRLRPAAMKHDAFLAEFRDQLSLLQGAEVIMPGKITFLENEVVAWPRGSHDPSLPESDGVDLWPRDPNLYRNAMFEGWFVNDEEIFDPIDLSEQTICVPL